MSTPSLFQFYVLGGGWAMLLLIPASLVTMFAGLRLMLALGERAARAGADAVGEEVQSNRGASPMTLESLQVLVERWSNDYFATLQPMVAMFVLAPLVGLAGSTTALMGLLAEASAGRPERVASGLEQALVPLLVGVVIGGLAYAGYAVGRWRAYRIERDYLWPAATAANREKGRLT